MQVFFCLMVKDQLQVDNGFCFSAIFFKTNRQLLFFHTDRGGQITFLLLIWMQK